MELLVDVFVSELLGKPVIDRLGNKMGMIKDILLDANEVYPAVSGLIIRSQGELKQIPWQDVYTLSKKFITLCEDRLNVHFKDIPEGQYRTSLLLDRQIVDINGAKVVRVNDIQLAGPGASVHLVAVDVGFAGLVRRLFAGRLPHTNYSGVLKPSLIRWDTLQPLPTNGDRLSLRVSSAALSKMHPADLADIIEELPIHQSREFFEQLTPDIAADALAEVDMDMQVSIIKNMDKGRAADILIEMGQDEAVDILSEMTEEDSEELLNLIEAEKATDLRELLEYEEGTAGSLMTTDFLAFAEDLSADQVIQRLRESAPEAEYVYYLYVVDSLGCLSGVLSLRELIVSPPDQKIRDFMHSKVISVTPEDGEKQVRRLFTKYSLLALPVVNDEGLFIGIITVDDVLSLPVNTRGLRM